MLKTGNFEVVLWARNIELVEEDLRHVLIVVLTRMNQDFVDLFRVIIANDTRNGGGLNELRARPDNGDDLQATASATALTMRC